MNTFPILHFVIMWNRNDQGVRNTLSEQSQKHMAYYICLAAQMRLYKQASVFALN